MAELSVGDPAPAFTLPDQNSQPVSLGDHAGRRVLIYFYPKANTPGCAVQSKGLSAIAGDIGDTAILGISPDAPDRQRSFDDKYSLGFPLLSDPDHAVSAAYGAWGEKSLYGRKYQGIIRSAFLVGPDGNLEQVWYPISPGNMPKFLLRALAG